MGTDSIILSDVSNTIETVKSVYYWALGGGFALVLSVLGLIIGVSVWWGGAKSKLKKLDGVEDDIKNINISLGILIKQFEKFEKTIEGIQGKLSIIGLTPSSMSTPLIEGQSPISLTEAGKILANEEKLSESISNRWEHIKKFIKSNCEGMNPYDIQQFLLNASITDLDELLDSDGVKRLKDRAYNNGLPLSFFSGVVAILIRDRYLKEEGISTEEIDRNDPNKNEK